MIGGVDSLEEYNQLRPRCDVYNKMSIISHRSFCAIQQQQLYAAKYTKQVYIVCNSDGSQMFTQSQMCLFDFSDALIASYNLTFLAGNYLLSLLQLSCSIAIIALSLALSLDFCYIIITIIIIIYLFIFNHSVIC